MATKVERCELAPGFSISRVLTGLWQIADMERDGKSLDPKKAATQMQPYLDQGFSTFDMADHYGSAEIIAGTFRRGLENPDDVQLLTKWVPTPGEVTQADVRQAVDRALDRLQVSTIDLLQFHAWNYADPNWLDCLYWLQELKSAGKIRHLGLTNFDAAHLRIALNSGIDVVSNQVCFSLLDQRAKTQMLPLCEEYGIKVLAFGTVAGGLLTERWLGKSEVAADDMLTWSQMKYKRFVDNAGGWDVYQNLLETIHKIANTHSVSMANVACRYILDQPGVGGIIIGARLGASEHLSDNLRLFEFSLDNNSRNSLEAALAEMQTIPGDCGDEYRKPPFLTASGDLSHHLSEMPLPYEAQESADGRMRILSGTKWESLAGFCRAVRRGNRIWISGTTATHGNRAIGGKDPAAQFHFIVDKIEGALQSLGSELNDVVRTRIFVKRVDDWEPIARAHGERFRNVIPANTLVQADLVGSEYLVEMEVDAVVGE